MKMKTSNLTFHSEESEKDPGNRFNSEQYRIDSKGTYIFVTLPISHMGGVQAYVCAKSRYLVEKGWKVNILFGEINDFDIKFPELQSYANGRIKEMLLPPYKYSLKVINRALFKATEVIGSMDEDNCIIIESHDDTTSQWGELLAKTIGAKHVFFQMNENYRGKRKYYENKMDFYMFKFHRKEIMGTLDTARRLFNNYLEISEKDINLMQINEDPVRDIESVAVEMLEKKDYNICYIGRMNKPYVQDILLDVCGFAEKHKDASIQLILVGDTSEIQNILKECHEVCNTLQISELGELIPIPQELFRKVDVVLAGSGSARCSAHAGAITIVADSELRKSIGILGIDTQESVYWDGKTEVLSFEKMLEKVLIDRAYDNVEVKYEDNGVEKCTIQNFEAIRKSSPIIAYYDIDRLIEGKKESYTWHKVKWHLLRYKQNGLLRRM